MKLLIAAVLVATAAGHASAQQSTAQDKMPPHGDLPHGAPDRASSTAESKELNMHESDTIVRLHEANQTEIEVGKIASKNAASAQVKRYGEQLVKDHTQADRELTALAKRKSVKLGDLDRSKLDDLRATKGKDFDQAFLNKMEKDHKLNIELVNNARGQAQNPEFRGLLDKLLPVLQKHADHATKLNQSRSSYQKGPRTIMTAMATSTSASSALKRPSNDA